MRTSTLAILYMIILTACSTSNKISNSWKNPEVIPESAKFQTMAIFALVKDQQMRTDVEEAIASQMPNTIAVPSHKMITKEELADLKCCKTKVK